MLTKTVMNQSSFEMTARLKDRVTDILQEENLYNNLDIHFQSSSNTVDRQELEGDDAIEYSIVSDHTRNFDNSHEYIRFYLIVIEVIAPEHDDRTIRIAV